MAEGNPELRLGYHYSQPITKPTLVSPWHQQKTLLSHLSTKFKTTENKTPALSKLLTLSPARKHSTQILRTNKKPETTANC